MATGQNNKTTTVCVSRKGRYETITVPVFSEETEVDNPIKWLASGQKPKITIPASDLSDDSKLQMGANLIGRNLGGIIPIEFILAFIGNVMKRFFIGKLEVPWALTSKILIPTGDITPMSLVTLIESGDAKESELDNSMIGDDDNINYDPIEVLANLIAGYRIMSMNRGVTTNYQSNIKARINSTLKQSGLIQNDIDSGVYNQTTWVTNTEYRKLCALIDLFFSKFINTKYSPIRICVQGARYKDCTLISDYSYAEKFTGIPTMRFLELGVAGVINNESVNGFNYMSPDCFTGGYFPYIKEFNIIAKSPYSATYNPNSHNWIMMVAALLGENRGVTARLAPGGSNTQVLTNSLACAWNLRQRTDKLVQFAENDTKLKYYEDAMGSVEEKVVDALTIVQTMEDLESDNELADEIRAWAKGRVNTIIDPRDGSIGEYLKNTLG
ncbi:MAG: nucleocapsid protein [Xiangshan rhabdo-like virus 1]|uniref:Nucleoprotein n=1 Tax=Xiangshan rhabdo-like virus 1 TaxID=2886224 RepID=A0A8K1P3I7_9RHAB|nr:MAG: nucleocapsid protein [Xiangshan rhabdo-like virus 1]UDL13979.1 MAG: nucleocapsid protein [Xiangshan rhabdo-like virus 1]